MRSIEEAATNGGEIVVIPGDPAATARLREILGLSAPAPSEDALMLFAATASTDLGPAVTALERRRSAGGGALAVIVGADQERIEIEHRLRAGDRLETSNIAHVPALDERGADLVIEAVLRALGDEAVAAGRRNPGLRPAVGRRLVNSSARQSAAIGALPLPGVDMPALALLQVRLVAQLAALHDRPFGSERALEALAVVGAGFGWRALARSASGLVPVAGWAVRGTVAYGATRAVGEAALARLSAGHDLIEGAPIDRARPVIDRVVGRLRR